MGSNVIGQNDGGTLTAIFMDNVPGYNAQQDHVDAVGVDIQGDFGNMYIREVESFADSILNNKPLVVPASDALHVQKVIAAAYESTEKNIIINIK